MLNGDLNKEGIEDCVLIIKGTDKIKNVKDEFRGELDRYRRGIIFLFKINDHYELIVQVTSFINLFEIKDFDKLEPVVAE